MNVADLRKALEGIPDDMEVLTWEAGASHPNDPEFNSARVTALRKDGREASRSDEPSDDVTEYFVIY